LMPIRLFSFSRGFLQALAGMAHSAANHSAGWGPELFEPLSAQAETTFWNETGLHTHKR
jgi:hypothetical protein